MNVLRTFTVLLAFATSAMAQDITGTIQIDRKLTKRSVTAPVPIYQRGAVVKLGKSAEQDPLGFERSHVIVYLEGPVQPLAEKAHTSFAVQQLDREFVPDLIAVPAGATVSFPNMDPIFHNIFSLSRPKMFDLGSYDKGESRSVVFQKPGVVYVYCHLHPNMMATIVVTPNQWYARADREGHYHIRDVPPGQYTLVAWHKAAGMFRRPITVEAGNEVVASFVLPLTDDMRQMAHEKPGTSGPGGH